MGDDKFLESGQYIIQQREEDVCILIINSFHISNFIETPVSFYSFNHDVSHYDEDTVVLLSLNVLNSYNFLLSLLVA